MTVASAKRIGIDLGGTKIEGLVMDAGGEIAKLERVATPRDDYAGTISAIGDLVGRLEEGAGESPVGQSLRVGIGAPGAWLPDKGIMKNCNSVWLNGRALLPDLVRCLGPRVRIANDADCFALSEALAGAGKGVSSVFGVILGTGVGGGFVIDGRLLSGPNGLTGEWGHTPLPAPGAVRHVGDIRLCKSEHVDEGLAELESGLASRQCYCGRLNCIETFLSGPGLARTHQELWNSQRTPEVVARAEDEQSRQTMELYCHMLARSLAQVINIVDPAVIVLGGGLSNVKALFPRLDELLPRFVFSNECVTPVLAPRWGDSSGVRGAAWLWG